MDFQHPKPVYSHVLISQRKPDGLDVQALLGDLGKIDRLPLLARWSCGYGDFTEAQVREPRPGQRMTLVRRYSKPLPQIYLYEHKPAPIPEWRAFNDLLSHEYLDQLSAEQIKSVSAILGDYGKAPCYAGRMHFGTRLGLYAFKRTKDGQITRQAFLFPSDPTHRLIEEIGEDYTGATAQERSELDKMFNAIELHPENPKPHAERAVR